MFVKIFVKVGITRQRWKGVKPTFISESGFFECDVAYPKWNFFSLEFSNNQRISNDLMTRIINIDCNITRTNCPFTVGIRTTNHLLEYSSNQQARYQQYSPESHQQPKNTPNQFLVDPLSLSMCCYHYQSTGPSFQPILNHQKPGAKWLHGPGDCRLEYLVSILLVHDMRIPDFFKYIFRH